MASKITGSIIAQGQAADPDLASIVVDWAITPHVGNVNEGQNAFPVDVRILTDTEIEASLRVQLSAHVSAVSGIEFTSADVLGCKF